MTDNGFQVRRDEIICQSLLNIFQACLKVNKRTEKAAFFDFIGHVEGLSVHVSKGKTEAPSTEEEERELEERGLTKINPYSIRIYNPPTIRFGNSDIKNETDLECFDINCQKMVSEIEKFL